MSNTGKTDTAGGLPASPLLAFLARCWKTPDDHGKIAVITREIPSARPDAVRLESRTTALAETDEWLGQRYLRVNGMIVAMEGDRCRDPNIGSYTWDRATLELVASRINAAAEPMRTR